MFGEQGRANAAFAAAQDAYGKGGAPLAKLEGDEGENGEEDARNPEAGDDFRLVQALLLEVMWCRGDIRKMRRPSPYFFLVYLK